MPVRSLTSSVLKWPDRQRVVEGLERWAAVEAPHHPELLRLGYFGSYARGDWGVGSDLDLVAVVAEASEEPLRRAVSWDLSPLPVPAELLVLTAGEWRELQARGTRFARTLAAETVWLELPGR